MGLGEYATKGEIKMIIMEKKSSAKPAIAWEIMRQLGSHKFVAMVGAYAIMPHDNGVGFKFHGSKKYNHLRIILTPMDEYDMVFTDRVGIPLVIQGVYADQLQEIFTDQTGLLTTL